MDRGKDVVTDDAFRDQDGVFKVATIPGHEGAQNVTAQSQFTQLGGWSIGNNVAGLDHIPPP